MPNIIFILCCSCRVRDIYIYYLFVCLGLVGVCLVLVLSCYVLFVLCYLVCCLVDTLLLVLFCHVMSRLVLSCDVLSYQKIIRLKEHKTTSLGVGVGLSWRRACEDKG